jgi:hypothetical protein
MILSSKLILSLINTRLEFLQSEVEEMMISSTVMLLKEQFIMKVKMQTIIMKLGLIWVNSIILKKQRKEAVKHNT